MPFSLPSGKFSPNKKFILKKKTTSQTQFITHTIRDFKIKKE